MKAQTYRNLKLALGITSLTALSLLNGYTSVVTTGDYNETSQAFYPVSSTDLIEGVIGTGISNSVFATNGNAGGNDYQDSAMNLDYSPYSVIFLLDTTINNAGYDITTINTYAGSSSYRVNQYYEIYYTTVANSSWTLLTSVAYQPYNDPNGSVSLVSTWVNITDTEGVLASGVNGLRFDMQTQPVGSPSNLGASYREIDVFGVASVPEPGSIMLMAAGGLALLLFKRRRLA
jgi:hypothetical protein